MTAGLGSLTAVTVTPPEGWRSMGVTSYSDTDPWAVRQVMFERVYDGAASWVFSHASASSQACATAWVGVDNTQPQDVPAQVATQGAGASIDAPSLTTVTPGAVSILHRGSWDGSAITPPTDWSEVLDVPVHWLASREWATVGPTGTIAVSSGNGSSGSPEAIIHAALRPAGAGGGAANPGDALGITDAAAITTALARNQGDPLGLTDTAQVTTAAVRSIADHVGLTDSLQVVTGAGVSAADPIGLADTVALSRAVAPADGIGMTDAVGTAVAKALADDDSVGITDDVTAALSMARTIADQVGASDIAAADQAAPGRADLDDPLGVTELLVTTAQILRSAADSLGVTDELTVALIKSASPADLLGVSDTVTVQAGAAPTPADAVGISDSATAVLIRVVKIADQLGALDKVGISKPAIPPLPIYGVSVTFDAGTRGLTPTGEARDLEDST